MSANTQLVCPHCSKINRVPAERLTDGPTCGTCRKQLFTGKPLKLDDDSLKRHVQKDGVPIVIDFWAPWCGPCKAMAPVFEAAACKHEPKIRFGKLNTDDYPDAAAPFGIRGIPTIIVFKNGREANRISGAMNQSQFDAWISKLT